VTPGALSKNNQKESTPQNNATSNELRGPSNLKSLNKPDKLEAKSKNEPH
jgi:hypothetical protein